MMEQIFSVVEITFDELALSVWPNLLSGRRVERFTCCVTALPEVPFTMLNFITPPNGAFKDFGVVSGLQWGMVDVMRKFHQYQIDEVKKVIGRFKRRLTKMGQPCKTSGFALNMCSPLFNIDGFYVGPFYNHTRRHFGVLVPRGKEVEVLAHFRALNQLFPETSLQEIGERYVFTYTDDLYADKALSVIMPARTSRVNFADPVFLDKVAQARLLLQNPIAFENTLPNDPRFWQGGLLDLRYYLVYLSRASSSDKVALEVMTRFTAKAVLMIKPIVDLENAFHGLDETLDRLLAEIAPVEYQEIKNRVGLLGDLVNFRLCD